MSWGSDIAGGAFAGLFWLLAALAVTALGLLAVVIYLVLAR